jgi:hypothetical protein
MFGFLTLADNGFAGEIDFTGGLPPDFCGHMVENVFQFHRGPVLSAVLFPTLYIILDK